MIKNPYRGKFIVFEGIDGSGTSTQSELLFRYFRKQGKKVYLTSEPSQSMIGGLIRSQLANHWHSSPECFQILFAADRDFHLENEITPLLKKGITVICTRYTLCSLAYGSLNGGDTEWLIGLNQKFIWPDITFLIDTPAKTCVKRIKKERFHEELFEKEEKLNDALKNYLALAKRFKGVVIINGEKPIKEVFEDIKSACEKRELG